MLCFIFRCLPAPGADLTRFRRVIVRWVSTAKRKTRMHTHFRSARRSKQINPLKITLPTQFLPRIEEVTLKVDVSLFATQFRRQRLRYDTFFCEIASPTTSNIASSNEANIYLHLMIFSNTLKRIANWMQWVSSEFLDLYVINTTRLDFDCSMETMRLLVGLTNKARGFPGSILVCVLTNRC